jgi:hypothetical protein
MENVFDVPKNFVGPETNFGPVKWYTDRNFFGDWGGVGSTNNFFGTGRAQLGPSRTPML